LVLYLFAGLIGGLIGSFIGLLISKNGFYNKLFAGCSGLLAGGLIGFLIVKILFKIDSILSKKYKSKHKLSVNKLI